MARSGEVAAGDAGHGDAEILDGADEVGEADVLLVIVDGDEAVGGLDGDVADARDGSQAGLEWAARFIAGGISQEQDGGVKRAQREFPLNIRKLLRRHVACDAAERWIRW